MPVERLKKYLDENGVRYETIIHSPAATAQETAAFAHVPGRQMAKTVMVKIDGSLAMVVVPAPHQVSLELVREAANAGEVALATEQEFRARFPDCEVGAMPPFGNLYDMDVYVSKGVTENEHIAFNAGTHRELMRLSYRDFARLVQPKRLEALRESGQPGGGVGRRDEVGGSGVYPASAGYAPIDSVVRTPAAWGQGDRGAAGYEDAGQSELFFYEAELRAAGIEPKPEETPEEKPETGRTSLTRRPEQSA